MTISDGKSDPGGDDRDSEIAKETELVFLRNRVKVKISEQLVIFASSTSL